MLVIIGELISSSKKYCKYVLYKIVWIVWVQLSFFLILNILQYFNRRITYDFSCWWRYLFIDEIVNYFQAESLVHCSASFFSFLDSHRWLEIHPSVTFVGIDIFFLKLTVVLRTLYSFGDKAQVLKKKFLWKKMTSNSKNDPKTGFFCFLQTLSHYSCLA